ncbi:YsnF/AvaK domain-containing protein [Arthrobacter sp. I2-34]|uniref:YsnF/AvaK domain-containing protein n=1 Tax=Arthrobacter hankyongi TaxID=2904801 RepID=A0ABS9L2G8_9MICC|nr:YsnF/AvaK domain-containing protein [Arthrobacter hankyongi]MCG2620843.1 YsnF/AvaK domain-containing protein [Arthrobacter hankyongi]
MIAREHIDRLVGSNANVVDSEGNKIGSLGQLYLDDQTDIPNWATVKTGLFGMSETFFPLNDAMTDGDDVRVPYSKDQIKDAPRVDPDDHLSEADEDRLYQHYGLAGARSASTGDTGTAGYADTDGMAGTEGYEATSGTAGTGHDTSGPTTDDAMTRSVEQLHVGRETRETGRARLRKYVVTENVTQTVPVSHEEVVVEREPITGANRGAAVSGSELSEEEHEVILHEERPVVEKETVPVERVRLGTETVTDEETVSEQVRKEQIEADGTGRRSTDRRDREL